MYKYLWKSIIKAISIIIIILAIFISCFKFTLCVSKNKDGRLGAIRKNFQLMGKWMTLLENGEKLSDILKKKTFYNIGVYGAGMMGEHVVRQLQNTEVTVKYVVDRSIFRVNFKDIPVYRMTDTFPSADVIIVTPVWDYKNIKKSLEQIVDCPIISLETLLEAENV